MAMASVNSIKAFHLFLPITKTRPSTDRFWGSPLGPLTAPKKHGLCLSLPKKRRDCDWSVGSVADDLDIVIPVQSSECTDPNHHLEEEEQEAQSAHLVDGFADERPFRFESGGGKGAGVDLQGTATSAPAPAPAPLGLLDGGRAVDADKMMERAINAGIVLALGTFAVTKLLTIDQDYWHGWTVYEILRYAPEHNWTAYEEALKTNPVLAKMMISGVVYSLGDWIAQCYEGNPLFEFDRARMFRSGLVGFSFHGSLSHYYYYLCEALFPFQDWWVVPAKVLFDQTVWAAVWNSIYFVLLGFLRLESPSNILSELKATFWPMLTAGWKLWPFAHLITYGVIPVEQRLLWVDCVELVWVTILSTYSNEKSEARSLEASPDMNTKPPSISSKE